jgi:hypothetical protein
MCKFLPAPSRAEVKHRTLMLERRTRLIRVEQHPADGVANERLQRLEAAVLEPEHPVGDLAQPLVVADDHDGRVVVLGELTKQAHRLGAVVRVEVGGRLVSEDQRRVVGDRARDSHALLLAAGELLDGEVKPFGETHRLEQAARSLTRRLPSLAGDVERHLDVLARRQCRDQVEVLKDEAEGARAEGRQLSL